MPAGLRILEFGRRRAKEGRPARGGFTLLELLLAVSLLAVVTSVTYFCFSTVITGWKRSLTLIDDLHHGDFVMEQLVLGLRSAYYPDTRQAATAYGFSFENNGGGAYSSDEISWVKLGGALVGNDCPFMGSPHRVRFAVQEAKGGKSEAVVTAWQVIGQPEDFDPEKLKPTPISRRITGFKCRMAYRLVQKESEDKEIEWLDRWDETNRLPTVVELTLYLDPLEKGEEPVEIKRVVGIPVAPLSWR